MDFCGNWKNNGKILSIQKNEKTLSCSLPRKNIGIIFNNDLVVSEFDDTAHSAGIGVYSPIGDGRSNFALWSSLGTKGQLGSGIALKCDESPGFAGEYNVRYFVGNHESASFLVKIVRAANEGIHKLSWFIDSNIVLHGIGFLINDSLAFAWGSTDRKFDFNRFCCCFDNGKIKLINQKISWDSVNIISNEYIRV